MTAGKPLRFMAAMLGGWIALRAFALWPSGEQIQRAVDLLGAAPVAAAVRPAPAQRAMLPRAVAVPQRGGPTLVGMVKTPASISSATRILAPFAEIAPFHSSPAQVPMIPPPLVRPPILSDVRDRSRWQASAWLIARGGARLAPLGGQFGASQAGARVTYAVLPASRLALAGRVATPLAGQGREVAFGVDWQPTRAPIHVIVEQRIAIDGGRGGPTVEIVGGFGPQAILPGVNVEAYAQAGGILRDSLEGFVDGAARATHRIAQSGRLRVDLGVGAWGGAQRGASRLDIGPSAGMVVPVGDAAVRVTLDWRHRIAGSAAPGSGPALSIGSDF